jgi:hypothetical protein
MRRLSIAVALCTPACSEKFVSEDPGVNIPAEGLLLWMRADRGVTQQGGQVTQWDDQSPSKMHATQDLANLQPTFLGNAWNGLPAVVFDGADDGLQFGSGFEDFSKGLSLFGVFEREDTDVCGAMFEASNGKEVDDISFGLSGGQLNYEVEVPTEQGTDYPPDVPVLFSIVHHTDEVAEIRRDGRFGSRGTFPLPVTVQRDAIYVGKSLYEGCPSFNGKISEIIAYNRELPDDEVSVVEQALQKKYGCCTP